MASENPLSGTEEGAGTAATTSGGKDWTKILGDLLGGATSIVGGTQNAATLAVVAGLMQMLQKEMDKSVTSPKEAVTATENMRQYYTDRAGEAAAPKDMVSKLQGLLTGNVNNTVAPTATAPTTKPTAFNPGASTPNATPAVNNFTPVSPTATAPTVKPTAYNPGAGIPGTTPAAKTFAPITPTVTAPTTKPTAFNPYANGGGIGGASSDLMAKLKGIVSGGNGANVAWANNLATNSLANRAGFRSPAQDGVSGQLRAQPLPAGSTPTNNPKLQVGTPSRTEGATLEGTYGMDQQNTPQQLQADYAIFKKGPSEPGYLGAMVRLTNYFSSGKLPATAAATPAATINPAAEMKKVGLDPNYKPDPYGLSEAARLAMGY